MPVFPCFDPTTGASGGAAPGGSVDPVTPPAAASQSVAAGGSLAAFTFGAFTDPGARIASYAATVKNVVGTGTISGTGLGPYSFSGTADGEVITVELDAKDASSNVLATAVYTGSIATPTGGTSEWSQAAATDYTTTSTGSLSSGSAVIDGITYDVTVAAGDTITDNASGIQFSQTGAGFNYLGTDINNLVTTIDAPFRIAFSFDNLSLGTNGTAGVAIYSNTTPDAAITSSSFQLRLINSGGTYSMQLLRTSGATGGSSSFTVAGSTVLGSAPTSMVIELYVVGPMVFAAYTVGTTVIPSPATLATVTGTPATYAQMSGATGGFNFLTPAWWPYAWATAIIGSGPGATITCDVLAIDVQELV